MAEMLDKLKELCVTDGISGDEGAVRDVIIKSIDGKCEWKIDALGSIIAFKKGKKTPKNKVMLSAHMDEVGFIVKYINPDGTLKIESVGGIDPRVVFGRRVRAGKNSVTGVIGAKALHNLSAEEREKAVSKDDLYVDIGALSKAEAEKVIDFGDSVCFDSDFLFLGGSFIKSKAIDDRFGCFVLTELINGELEYDTYFLFAVQEEIGLRGAKAASYSIDPDYAVVVEATTAADIFGCDDEKAVCRCGAGPVVSFMDRSAIYNKELYGIAFETAAENGIPCQTKTMIAGGNDSGAIHVSRGGVKTIAVSLPCRYIHSPSCVASVRDIENTQKLVKLLTDRIYNI